jgi:phage shock protein PspC (stress-responsive transcriptional regulator)
MDKTIKINLAGIVFQIEEDAYRTLRDYLNAIDNRLKNAPGGNETLDDIESRIAEIFQSQKGLAGVISKENVDAMISIIGKPEDFEQSYQATAEPPRHGSSRRRLYRNPEDSIISGVCGGIGSFLNFDPVWVRLLFILFTISFGIGFFVYIALWIALPTAITDTQKRELYGENYNTRSSGKKNEYTGFNSVNNAGNALNEVFRAIGKFFYVILRIFLIGIGVTFVITGFAMLVTFIMTFFFSYSWFFFNDSFNPDLFYLPDMLDFFMRPELTPWVMTLLSLVVILPLLAFIYWGLKMIFWFRVRDWIVSMIALIIWVMSISALALIMFNQGISFAQTGNRVDQTMIETRHDTLYLKVDNRISSLKFDQEISVPDNEYSLYINKADNKLYGRPELDIQYTEDSRATVSVERYSHGKTRMEAIEKAESFIYNYRISNDTIFFDQYYQVPADRKWSGSSVEIDIMIPEGTVIWIDRDAEILLDNWVGNGFNSWELGGKFWRWDEDGPVRNSKDDLK